MTENSNSVDVASHSTGTTPSLEARLDAVEAEFKQMTTEFISESRLQDASEKIVKNFLKNMQEKLDELAQTAQRAIDSAVAETAKVVNARISAEEALASVASARSVAEAEKDKACVARTEADLANDSAAAAKLAVELEKEKIAEAKAAILAVLAAAENERERIVQISATAETEKDRLIKAATSAAASQSEAEAEKTKAFQSATIAEVEKAKAIKASIDADAARVSAETEFDKARQAAFHAEGERDKALHIADNIITVGGAVDVELAKVKQTSQDIAATKAETESACDLASTARAAAEDSLSVASKHAADAEAELAKARIASDAAESEASDAANAHNLSTTAGLAGAFTDKASKTQFREIFWGIVLVLALGAAAGIGWIRYRDLSTLIATKPDDWALGASFFLSLFGLGAPVWLAWMATKMISKNFVLTEDYAYKASIAKAYVGFRDQARGLDPLLEQRLFAAAVTQLDANPVRFLDSSHPASPIQELLQQPFMQDVLEDVSVKQHLIDWFKSRFNAKLSLQPKSDTVKNEKTE